MSATTLPAALRLLAAVSQSLLGLREKWRQIEVPSGSRLHPPFSVEQLEARMLLSVALTTEQIVYDWTHLSAAAVAGIEEAE